MTGDTRDNQQEGKEIFSFVAFSNTPFYQAINHSLVDLSRLSPGQRVVDLACGTGGVTKIILDKLRGARESLVIGVDMSAIALKQAREELETKKLAMVEFVQGQAEQLSQLVKESVDAVVFCNAIHLVTDKAKLVGEVFNTLGSGGVFAFNTSFFDGGHPPETEQWYRRWLFRSLRILRSEYGLTPVKQDKDEARQHISAEQYTQILKDGGFNIKEQRINRIDVPLEGWVTISQFEDWINGVMPGVPLREGSESLTKAAVQVFEEMNVDHISRNWLEIVAARP